MADLDPAFSIVALGRRLGALREREEQLDALAVRLGSEKHGAPMDAHRLAQRHARRDRDAMSARADALEDLILASRPDTLADAVLLVMVAGSRLNLVANLKGSEARGQEQDRVEGALSGALRVIAREAGVPLADVGGQFYASTWADPRPDVDLSSVAADLGCKVDCCIDGSELQPASVRAAA